MSKTKELEDLFVDWQKKQDEEPEESLSKTKQPIDHITVKHFCKDGIICEETFEKEKIRVLFIAMEANLSKEESANAIKTDRRENFLSYAKVGKDDWCGRMKNKTCKLFGYITKRLLGEKQATDPSEYALRFAFMNLNKRGGLEKSNWSIIDSYCKYYQEEIMQEIRIIDPNLVVWLGKGTFFENLKTNSVPIVTKNEKYYLDLFEKGAIPLICTYHTSCRFCDKKKEQSFQEELAKFEYGELVPYAF